MQMPVPLPLAIGAEALPFIMSLLAGGPERVDPTALLGSLLGQYSDFLRPAVEAGQTAAISAGARTGSALGQDVAAGVGNLGGGAAGTTRVARGLASSAASSEALAGGANALMQGSQAAGQLAAQSLPSAIAGAQGTRPSTGFQNFTQGLAGATATGGNPFRSLLGMAFPDKTSPSDQLMQLLQQNPDLLTTLATLFQPGPIRRQRR